jgi:three-Cys-motif partner protein
MIPMPRVVGDWTKDKLRILESYLPGYLQATTRTVERIYVDAFSGPGKNQLESTGEIIDGSPLLALKAQASNGTRFDRFYFIDEDRRLLDELHSHIEELRESRPCTILHGDVNTMLPRIMGEVNRRSPTFVFLDTDGIDPKWSTIQTIAPWRVEFLINFPLGMSINRNPDSQKTRDYFGTDECLPLLRPGFTGRTRALLDLYKNRLKDLGFFYTTENDFLVKTIDNRRLYYLVFVSKVKPAETIMNWVFRQPDVRGQRGLGI